MSRNYLPRKQRAVGSPLFASLRRCFILDVWVDHLDLLIHVSGTRNNSSHPRTAPPPAHPRFSTMPLMRNPFRRVPGEHGLDDDGKHGEAGTGVKSHSPSTPINIQTGDEKSNKEYKLSGKRDICYASSLAMDSLAHAIYRDQ